MPRTGPLGYHQALAGLVFFGAALLCAAPSAAAQPAPPTLEQRGQADVLVAQAVVAYGEKRYQEALAALREALALVPDHLDALFYTGLVRIALGQPEQAIEALEKARALNPTDEAIQFQLGVVYFSLGQYEKAQPLLEAVFARNPRLDGLGYYVGFMRYRSKDYQGALRAFREGASDDPKIQQLTRFYAGLAFGILGLPEKAAGEISEALRLQPASPLTGPAERLRDSVVTARERERPFHLELRVGGLYDDNVSVIPKSSSDPLITCQIPPCGRLLRDQKHTSPGWLASLRADYSFLRLGAFEATATYSVFSTMYNDIARLNIVDHLGGASASYRGALETPLGVFPYQAALQYSYDFLTLNGDEFVTRHTVTPIFTLVESQTHLTSFIGRYQHKRFALSPNPLQDEKRDGSNYMAGFIHIARFQGDKHLLKVGYQADWDLIQGGDFTYFGNRVLAGGQFTFPFAKPLENLRVTYDFDAHIRDYRNLNTFLPFTTGTVTLFDPFGFGIPIGTAPALISNARTKARFDTEYNHLVRLIYPLTGNLPFLAPEKFPGVLSLSADFQTTVARSNLDVFTFNRNVASLSLIWSY